MADIEHYKGREQTYIKHTLLMAYLKRLFMIIGQYAKRIRYVDCFAGPWQEGSEDLSDTSIAISLNIMRECHDGLLHHGKDVHFKALYIEKDRKAFNKLTSFLETETSNAVEAYSLFGEFFRLRVDILEWCGEEDFTFFFIDPTGWKHVVEPDTLHPLLQRQNSEFLINFMFDFVLRVHSQAAFEEHMKSIFGEIPNTVGMAPKKKENYLIERYLGELKKPLIYTGKSPRLAYAKILDPLKNRTKYDLVYLTRHPKGIVVFMEVSENLDIVQKKVRAQAKQKLRIEKSGQYEMFEPDGNLLENENVDIMQVKNYWLSKLSYKPERFGIEELADMLEDTRWFIGDFQKAFIELLNECKVKNLDAARKRPKNAVHFEKGEYLKKINK